MGAGGLKVASMVAQAPAPGLKYLGDQEASLGQELVWGGWGKALMGESQYGKRATPTYASSALSAYCFHCGEITSQLLC